MFGSFVIHPQGVLNVLDWDYLWYFCVRSRCLAAWFFWPVVCVSGATSWELLCVSGATSWELMCVSGATSWELLCVPGATNWELLFVPGATSWELLRVPGATIWELQFSTRRTRHTHDRSKKSRCQTPTTHTKISQVISVKHVQHSLRMDHKGSETCRSF